MKNREDFQVTGQTMGLTTAIATLVGCMVGASIFILLGPIAMKTGPSLFLAYILAFIPAALGSIAYAQMGAAIPSTGGSYVYASKALSLMVGFNQAMLLVLGALGASTMLALGFAQYLHFYLPSVPVMVTAVTILILLYLVNLLGLRMAGFIQVLMCVWMLLALLVFAVPGLLHVRPFDGPFLAHGVGGLLFAAALAFYSYTGFGIISELGGEVENPKKNIPLSIIISLLIVVIVYALVTYVSTGVIPWQTLAAAEAPVPAAAAVFLPAWVIIFIGIGALFATTTTINAVLMAGPREFVALSKDNLLPEVFTKVNKAGTPYFSLSILTVIPVLALFTNLKVDYFATITVVGLLGNSAITALAAWRLPKKLPREYEAASFRIRPFWLSVISLAGFLTMIVFILLAILDQPTIGIMFLIWIAACSAFTCFTVRRPSETKIGQ